MLEVSVGSFLSDAPDLEGLESAVGLLADVSRIDQESVRRDPEDGAVHGKLVIPGVDFEASFTLKGQRYEINLEPTPGQPLPSLTTES